MLPCCWLLEGDLGMLPRARMSGPLVQRAHFIYGLSRAFRHHRLASVCLQALQDAAVRPRRQQFCRVVFSKFLRGHGQLSHLTLLVRRRRRRRRRTGPPVHRVGELLRQRHRQLLRQRHRPLRSGWGSSGWGSSCRIACGSRALCTSFTVRAAT